MGAHLNNDQFGADSLAQAVGMSPSGLHGKLQYLAALPYGDEAIQENFLIDENGTTTARYMRGDNLKQQLKEIFELPLGMSWRQPKLPPRTKRTFKGLHRPYGKPFHGSQYAHPWKLPLQPVYIPRECPHCRNWPKSGHLDRSVNWAPNESRI